MLAFALFWVGVLVTIWAYNYSPEKTPIRSESSVTAIALENFVKSSTPDTTPVDAEVVWIGTFFRRMTYGRLLLKNFDSDVDYKYFVVEPDDVIADGAERYSPTTDKVGDRDVIKITGQVSDWCYRKGVTDWDDNVVYDGCVPWISIEKLEVVKNSA